MHLYKDFLSDLTVMDLLGNANNYRACADAITLINMDQTYMLCYIFSYSASSEFSVSLTMLQLLLVAMIARFDNLLFIWFH